MTDPLTATFHALRFEVDQHLAADPLDEILPPTTRPRVSVITYWLEEAPRAHVRTRGEDRAIRRVAERALRSPKQPLTRPGRTR